MFRYRSDDKMNNSNSNDMTVDPDGNPIPQEGGTPAEHPPRIGRYRIEKVLGKGGFGLVYLAHDEQLKRRMAVKMPHAKLISKPEDAEAYLAEARTVANLDHPGIVPVHDVGSTQEFPCYSVSKYTDGVDRSTKLKQHRLKYRKAAEIVATVAEALHYAHKQGLGHRDVKLGNILIGKDGNTVRRCPRNWNVSAKKRWRSGPVNGSPRHKTWPKTCDCS